MIYQLFSRETILREHNTKLNCVLIEQLGDQVPSLFYYMEAYFNNKMRSQLHVIACLSFKSCYPCASFAILNTPEELIEYLAEWRFCFPSSPGQKNKQIQCYFEKLNRRYLMLKPKYTMQDDHAQRWKCCT